MTKHALLLVALIACSKSAEKPKGSPDWGDDPRPLGSCVGTAKPTTKLPEGSPSTMCLEMQTKAECTSPSEHFDYSYAEHTTCASRGFDKKCEEIAAAANFPSSARFSTCPGGAPAAAAAAAAAPPAAPSPNLEHAKQVVAIFVDARKAIDANTGNCAAIGKQLAPLRDKLWELTQAHPSVLKGLTETELKSIKAADSFEAVAEKLPDCKDNVHAKEFAYAMGKAL